MIDFLKDIYSKSTNNLLYIFSIIFFSILTFTYAQITDKKVAILTLIAILLGILSLCLLTFTYNFYKDYKRIMMSEFIPTDIILKNYTTTIKFDDDTLTTGQTETTIHRKIFNNMIDSNKEYANYLVRIASLSDVPHLSENIKIQKMNDDFIPLSSFDNDAVNFTSLIESVDSEIDFPQETQILKFNVPLDLKAGELLEFKIRYRSEGYKKSLEGEVDYITLETVRITNEIKFEIILEGEYAKKYEITHATKESGADILSYEVLDTSYQRMKKTEHEMMKEGSIPKYEGTKAFWVISKPKIGYKYRFYFKLQNLI